MSGDELWVSIDEALRLVGQANDPLANAVGFAHRTRLAGWLIDGRVQMRFAESIAFEPEPEPTRPDVEKPKPNANGVQPLGSPYFPFQQRVKLRRVVSENVDMDHDDIDALRRFGHLEPLHEWWSTGEVVLDCSHLAPGARLCGYGAQFSLSDLNRALGIARAGQVHETSSRRPKRSTNLLRNVEVGSRLLAHSCRAPGGDERQVYGKISIGIGIPLADPIPSFRKPYARGARRPARGTR